MTIPLSYGSIEKRHLPFPNPWGRVEKNQEGSAMKNGFKVVDSDMHLIEPADLWQRYMDRKFRDGAPVGSTAPTPRNIGVDSTGGRPIQHREAQPHMA